TGAQFFSDWSQGAGRLAQRFADWMAQVRQTGQLRKWMDEGYVGAKQLLSGMKDLLEATYRFVAAFGNKTGVEALKSFADTMDRLVETTKQSAIDGKLKKWGDAIRNAGLDKWQQL